MKKIDTDMLFKNENFDECIVKSKNVSTNKIESKNIIRTKLQCQRLAKANSKDWKTFITLTFQENIKDIGVANKKFRNFVDVIKRKFRNFKYICIPEFQKRGAVHYHLLTNIDIEDNTFIYSQLDNPKYKHIKYWNYGFTKVDLVKNDIKKIIGYISKYMTKDIDNRLFNRHRYFYSRNLTKPTTSYLDLNNSDHVKYLDKVLKDTNSIYKNIYLSPYDKGLIEFEEFLSMEKTE